MQADSSEFSTPIIVSARLAGTATAARRQAHVGAGRPALQRPIRKILGHRRSDRPDRSRGVVGRPSRRGIHPGQPAARRRADGADGAVAVSADVAPLRQPALSAPRGDPRVRRTCATAAASAGHGASCSRTRRSRGPDRPRRRMEGQAGRAAERLRGRALSGPGAGVSRHTANARAAASTTSRPGARWPSGTAPDWHRWPRNCAIRRAPPSPNSPPSTPTPSIFTGGCSGSSTTSWPRHSRRPLRAGDGARHHARPRRRGGPQRRRRVGAAGRPRARRHRGRTAR